MARLSPALPLLFVCLAYCFPEVTMAATYDGAPRARDTDEDIDIIDVFDMAMEMRRLGYSGHDPNGGFGGNDSERLNDPSRTPSFGQRQQNQKFSPDEIALGLQNSDYIEEDPQDDRKSHRTVPVLAKINRILRDNASRRARTQSRTADGTADGTATSQDFSAVFMRSGLVPLDTTEAPWFTSEQPTDTTPWEEEEDYQFQARAVTPTNTTASTTIKTATTTVTDTLVVTDTTTETTTETITETTTATATATEFTTATHTVSVTTTYTEVEFLTSTVVEADMTSKAAAVDAHTPTADQSKGPEITPVQPVSPSGWLYGSLAFAGLGLMLMVAGGVWLIITFVRKASMNGRRGIV